jgi:hypothetical protein
MNSLALLIRTRLGTFGTKNNNKDFAASSPAEKGGAGRTLRQAPQTLYKPVRLSNNFFHF